MQVTPGFCVFWAFLILTLPIKFLLAAAGAAAFHELCHGLAVRLAGGRILSVHLGAGGMVMQTDALPPGHEVLCILAGPAGSLMLGCLPLSALSLCGLAQGIFNLLPLLPLDGGRILGTVLEMTIPQHRARVEGIVQILALLLLLSAAWQTGPGGLLLWLIFVSGKIPCKPWGKRVQ